MLKLLNLSTRPSCTKPRLPNPALRATNGEVWAVFSKLLPALCGGSVFKGTVEGSQRWNCQGAWPQGRLHQGKTGIVHSLASGSLQVSIPKTWLKIRSAWEVGREDNFLKDTKALTPHQRVWVHCCRVVLLHCQSTTWSGVFSHTSQMGRQALIEEESAKHVLDLYNWSLATCPPVLFLKLTALFERANCSVITHSSQHCGS